MSAAGVMVRFSVAGEFLDEMTKCKPQLVRVTKEYRGTKFHPLRTVHVVATFLDRDPRNAEPILVRLDSYCGETMESEDHADKRASALVDRMLEHVRQQSIEHGSGIFEYQAS